MDFSTFKFGFIVLKIQHCLKFYAKKFPTKLSSQFKGLVADLSVMNLMINQQPAKLANKKII